VEVQNMKRHITLFPSVHIYLFRLDPDIPPKLFS